MRKRRRGKVQKVQQLESKFLEITCKQCKETKTIEIFPARSHELCSDECRRAWNREYMREYMRKKREAEKYL